MNKLQIICNAMSELRQFQIEGKNKDKDSVISHLQTKFQFLDDEEPEQVYNHMLALV